MDDSGGDLIECSGKYCKSCTAGLIADCVALCCCSCAVVHCFALAFVKAPWVIGRRCLGLGKKNRNKKCKRRMKMLCWRGTIMKGWDFQILVLVEWHHQWTVSLSMLAFKQRGFGWSSIRLVIWIFEGFLSQDYGFAGRMDTNGSLRVASLWPSMRAISQQLSPISDCSGIELLQADTFDLHCFQSLTGAQSQLVCSGCRNLLVYPVGATSVCCAVCNAVTAVPPPDLISVFPNS